LRLLESANKEPWWATPIIILAIFAGLRSGNILKLEWIEVHFSSGYIQIPGSKTKNGKTLIIPMCDMVYNTLCGLYQTRHQRADSRYVFVDDEFSAGYRRKAFSREFKIGAVRRVLAGESQHVVARDLGVDEGLLCKWKKRVRAKTEDNLHTTPRREKTGGPIPNSAFEQVWNRIREDSGIGQDFREYESGSRKGFCFHDLRHTNATFRALTSTDIYDLQRHLGHEDLRSTQRYIDLVRAMRDDERKILTAKIKHLFGLSHPDMLDIEAIRAAFARLDGSCPKNFLNGPTNGQNQATVGATLCKEIMIVGSLEKPIS